MQLWTLLAIIALVGAVVSLDTRPRVFAAIAVAASGVEVAIALGLLSISVSGVSLPLVLGGALAVAGAMLLGNAAGKTGIAAATVVTLVGVLQALTALRIVHG